MKPSQPNQEGSGRYRRNRVGTGTPTTHSQTITHTKSTTLKKDLLQPIDFIGGEHDVQRRVSTSHDVFFGNRVRGGQLG